jgi:uncharacterized membrane protein HdeD (DUF308 family)
MADTGILRFQRRAFGENPRAWGVYTLVGVGLILLGIFALGSISFTSYFTTLLLGWILVIAGAMEFFSIFFSSEHRLMNAMLGILYAMVGLVIVSNPSLSLAALTLFLAIAWTVSGLVRTVSAFSGEAGARAWNIFGGIVTFLLGVFVWIGWPESSLFVVGLFVGLDLLLAGAAMTALGFRLRRLRAT